MKKKNVASRSVPMTEEFALAHDLFLKNEDGTLKMGGIDGNKYIIFTRQETAVSLGGVNTTNPSSITSVKTPYPPAYSFDIGEEVIIGNLIHPHVVKIMDDGLYLIEYFSIETNYGRPIVNYSCGFWHWYDIRKVKEQTSVVFTVGDDLRTSNYAKTIDSFIHQYYRGIDMYPKYQRDYVWSDIDRKKLLDSIFNCINIGSIAIARVGGHDEIVDGKQRLKTIIDFYEGRFTYHGLHFDELSYKDLHTFKNTIMSCVELETDNQLDAIKLFVRMNTSGKKIDDAILQDAIKLLKEGED